MVADDAYLTRADLRRLSRYIGEAGSAPARERARLVRLTPHAADAEPAERAAMFSVTAALEQIPGFGTPADDAPYWARWADTTGRHELLMLSGHTGELRGLSALTVDGEPLLASASDDGTVRLWHVPSGTERAVLTGHSGPVRAVDAVVSQGRAVVVSAGSDGTVRAWDAADGTERGIIGRHRSAIRALAVVPGERPLVLSAADGEVRLSGTRAGSTVCARPRSTARFCCARPPGTGRSGCGIRLPDGRSACWPVTTTG